MKKRVSLKVHEINNYYRHKNELAKKEIEVLLTSIKRCRKEETINQKQKEIERCKREIERNTQYIKDNETDITAIIAEMDKAENEGVIFVYNTDSYGGRMNEIMRKAFETYQELENWYQENTAYHTNYYVVEIGYAVKGAVKRWETAKAEYENTCKEF